MTPVPTARPSVGQLAPNIPGLTTPVAGFSGGVYKLLLENHGSPGLICILRTYDGQVEGDLIQLFCGDLLVPIDHHNVSKEEARDAKSISLHISMARLDEGAVGPVFFRVTHPDQRAEETQRLTLKIDTVAPTGNDLIQQPPWVNEQLPRPQPAHFLIDSAAAQRGVAVRIPFYPSDLTRPSTTHRAVRDRIRLIIGGQIIEHSVTENEASGTLPISIMVYYGTWLQIGSGYQTCAYDVIDEVGNYAPGRSPTQLIEVRLNPNERLLDPAHVVEAPTGTLDADALLGKDATLRFAVAGKGWALGDEARLTLRGRALDGGDVDKTYTVSITSTTPTFTDVPWPNADVRALIGAMIELSYERVRAGQANVPSENAFVRVTGTPEQTALAAPQVPAASGGVLPPLTDPVLVTITSYTGQKPFDCVTLVLEGANVYGHRFYREYVAVAGEDSIVFELPNSADGDIRQLDGGELMLYYFINHIGQRPPSDILSLRIGDPLDALAQPEVLQAPAPGFTFDPDVSLGNADVRVPANAAFVVDATVTLYCEGSAVGGSAPPDAFLITPPWVGQELAFVIQRQFILANLNGSARIYYRVEKPGQRTRYSKALVITVGSRLQLPVPLVLESTVTGLNSARLNPQHVLNPPICTLRVSYTPMLASDDIQPSFVGTHGQGTPSIAARPGDPVKGYVDFILSNKVISANLGQKAVLSYIVTRAGADTASQLLTLTIDPFQEQVLDLVTVPQASNGIVRANMLNSVLILAWPFISVGQAIWVDLKGAANLALLDGVPLTAAQFSAGRVEVTIPADYLRSLPTQSTLTIEVRVSLNGSANKTSAIRLRTAHYRITNTVGVFATIAVGRAPNAMVLSPNGELLYVACAFGDTSIWIIDTLRNRVIHHFAVPGTPLHIAINPTAQRLYVTDNSVAVNTPIRVYNTQDYTLIDTITGFTTVAGITLNANGSRLYVADTGASELVVINTTNHQRLSSIPVREPIDVVISPDNNRAHVATFFDWSILNLHTNTLIDSVDTPSAPSAIAHNPRGAEVYIVSRTGGSVTIGNTVNHGIPQRLTGLSGPLHIAFERGRDRAYVSQTDGDLLGIIDTRSRQLIGTYAGFNKPRAVVVAPDGSHGYVANIGGDSVSLVVF